MRILVTGTAGQVVRALMERGAGRAEIVPIGRPVLDLEQPGTIAPALATARADVVVNAAAFTAVDRAEAEPDRAERINAVAAGEVARAARGLGVPIIQLSTDYVYDGVGETAYREDDAVAPIGVYGRTKLAGERQVAEAQPDHVILRTAWVYSPFGQNFLRTMLRLGQDRREVAVVSDQRGCPTNALDLADVILGVSRRLVAEPERLELRGVFHAAGGGETSWAGFAQAIFEEAERFGRGPVMVRPISTSDYPTAARRPSNSMLDCSKLERRFGLVMPHWHAGVGACVERVLGGSEAA